MKEKQTNFTKNQLRIRDRIIQEARYMIVNQASCHKTAKHFQTNPENIRKDVTTRFVKYVLADKSLQGLYIGVKIVIEQNRSEKVVFPDNVLYFIAKEILCGKTKYQVIQSLPLFFEQNHIPGKSHISIDVLDQQIERIKELENGSILYENVKNQLYIHSNPPIIIPVDILQTMLDDYFQHESLHQLERDYHYSRAVILKNFEHTFPNIYPAIEEIKKRHQFHSKSRS